MPNNITEFPAKNIRNWIKISKLMKKQLMSKGISESAAAEFVSNFKPIYDTFDFSYQFSFKLPDESSTALVNKEIVKFTAAFMEHTSKLLYERFVREVEITYLYINR